MMTSDAHTALITGASSGLGAAFARKLASQGYGLVLVARREKRLVQLATILQRQYPIHVEVLVADLAQAADFERVEKRIAELTNLELLVNNAGFGVPGKFAEVPLNRTLEMIDVHVGASTRLSRAALPGMIVRGGGGIINVASIGAFIPRPQDAVYCATKAYLVAFSRALQGELEGTGVRVQVLCPGFVPTEFLDHPEYEALQVKGKIPQLLWTPVGVVVEESLRSLERGKVICIPGFKNRTIVVFARSGLAGILLKILANNLRKPNPLSVPQPSLKREH
ncbi:MAG: SDR family oxidoreductase [Anaerolineales bacterium]